MTKELFKSIQQSNFQSFISEINNLKETEKRDGSTANFNNVSVGNLTIDDMEIYTKLRNHTLTLPEFEQYRLSVSKEKDPNRIDFAAYIANEFTIQNFRKSNIKKQE